MRFMTGNEIRSKYLNFFESKEHLVLQSAGLVPENDPTLLLIGAGMAPFKAFFTGKMQPPSHRIATCQKCVRTGDIENVGRTARHHTFFEMLGNFSFGDYFKSEACAWAWEFITQPEWLNIPADKVWITIHPTDDEAFDIWSKEVGIPADRIVRLEDNFWEIGQGPCGPCSELYVDLGAERGCSPDCKVGCECDRYLEIWNLVFTQFNKEEDGSYSPLEKKNIDTGAGLERITSIMQSKPSNFETDLIFPIIDYAQKLATVKYGDAIKSDISLKVIADHSRSMTVMIGDGVLPSNEGRGYVLRRILRRAVRHGKLIGIKHMFLAGAVDTVINIFAEAYPELKEKRAYIQKVIQVEEERFNTTLEQGLDLLNAEIKQLESAGLPTLDGRIAFKLYDTFGFPWELTDEILNDHHIQMDKEGFKAAMEEQRERARAARGEKNHAAAMLDLTGIDTSKLIENDSARCAQIVAMFDEYGKQIEKAFDGQDASIILSVTPFYAEGGGQLGDIGEFKTNGATALVSNTMRLPDGSVVHLCSITEGQLSIDEAVQVEPDAARKLNIARNHTATHLLHQALKTVLGEHVNQAGSYVTENGLRFDFSHFSQVTKEELQTIEQMVNEQVLKGLLVTKQLVGKDEAKKMGATALFGEKYGDVVRVVSIDNYSVELCGGTHLDNTAQVALFKILSESSTGAGIRRIEAVTGAGVLSYLKEQEKHLHEIAIAAKCRISDIVTRVEAMQTETKELQSKVAKLTATLAEGKTQNVEEMVQDIKGVQVLAIELPAMAADELRNFGDKMRDKIQGLVVLASVQDDKVNLLAMATKEAVAKGVHAGNIIKEAAKITGGGGGGRPDMAQAGGKDPAKIGEALEAAVKLAESQIK